MRAPVPSRLRLLLVTAAIVVIVPSIARWQLAVIGIGLVAIGLAVILQRQLRRRG